MAHKKDLLESFVPVVRYNGLKTETATSLSGPVSVTGALTASGLVKVTNPVKQQAITNIDAQSASPTIAQILGGVIVHTSVTGAGTATVPTGTAMSAGISGVAVGSTVEWIYYNDGNQTVTITPAATHTLVGGTAAVTTGKWMPITSVCVSANTWVSYLTTLF
jgi:hypothetical protein